MSFYSRRIKNSKTQSQLASSAKSSATALLLLVSRIELGQFERAFYCILPSSLHLLSRQMRRGGVEDLITTSLEQCSARSRRSMQMSMLWMFKFSGCRSWYAKGLPFPPSSSLTPLSTKQVAENIKWALQVCLRSWPFFVHQSLLFRTPLSFESKTSF